MNVFVDLSTLQMGMCLVVQITVSIDSSRTDWLACLSVETLDSSAYRGQHTHVMWLCRLYFQGLQTKLFLDAHLLAFLLLELGHCPSQLEVQNLLQICTLLNLSHFFLNRQSQQFLAELRIILFIKPVESSQYLVQFPPHWLPFCYLKLFICKVSAQWSKIVVDLRV